MEKIRVYVGTTEAGTVLLGAPGIDSIELLMTLSKWVATQDFKYQPIKQDDGTVLIHYYFENMTLVDFRDLLEYIYNYRENGLDKYELIFI